jgi:predicted enzyme related to lactoylglutathione lyase
VDSAFPLEPANYGFVDRITTPEATGIPGGISGGAGYPAHVIFYVGVPDVEAALAEAERLGGNRRMGPERAPTGLVVGHFTDPEGQLDRRRRDFVSVARPLAHPRTLRPPGPEMDYH